MSPVARKPVLVAPLDWGLGHAARCMPIIDRLLDRGFPVHLAGNGASLHLLTDRYPALPVHELPGYHIHYPVDKNASVQILLQSPRMFRTIRQEQEQTEKIVAAQGIGTILSDNRYGVHSSQCRSIILCHQVAIQSPGGFGWTQPFFRLAHFRMMRPFSELWIPDLPGEPNLAGKLAHGFSIPMPHRYIGHLSRFKDLQRTAAPDGRTYRVVALLSGNEPQRTHFEKLLTTQLQHLQEPCLLIQGVTSEKSQGQAGNVRVISYLQAAELLPYLQAADVIICRSGYSTLMDMAALGKKALLIPTPGQTEQEYLAAELQRKGVAAMMEQDKLDIKTGLANAAASRGLHTMSVQDHLLEETLDTIS